VLGEIQWHSYEFPARPECVPPEHYIINAAEAKLATNDAELMSNVISCPTWFIASLMKLSILSGQGWGEQVRSILRALRWQWWACAGWDEQVLLLRPSPFDRVGWVYDNPSNSLERDASSWMCTSWTQHITRRVKIGTCYDWLQSLSYRTQWVALLKQSRSSACLTLIKWVRRIIRSRYPYRWLYVVFATHVHIQMPAVTCASYG